MAFNPRKPKPGPTQQGGSKTGVRVVPLRADMTARHAVSLALAEAVNAFPDLMRIRADYNRLADEREARLATAIHRTAIQRWETLVTLLSGCLRQPWPEVEATLRGVLLAAAAQVLFMDRLPRYAVIDESVELARQLVRPGAAGLANAVLRKLSDAVGTVTPEPWTPAPDRLPVDAGTLHLLQPLLPPLEPLDEHLAAAVSIPSPLLDHWLSHYGIETATRLARHVVLTPPLILAVEPGFEARACDDYAPHHDAGFIVWLGNHDSMKAFLAANPGRRVQDPASSYVVNQLVEFARAKNEPVKLIVDFCAGRGTKTRQLAAAFPEARIIAAEPDRERLADLEALAAAMPNVRAVHSESLAPMLRDEKADVVLLDVPCSNTAVLARRPEARYRISDKSMSNLISIQRDILMLGTAVVRPGGLVVYSTCSLESAENQEQIDWANRRYRTRTLASGQILPSGEGGDRYHDGAFHAILRAR